MNSRRMRWEGCLACMGKTRDPREMLVRISEGKRQIGSLAQKAG
jgi:hypothetical protein